MAEQEYVIHTFEYSFQFFSDELDVQVADFESSKSDGKRLLSHVTDPAERESMHRQVNDVSERLEAIQRLVLDKERRVGDRYYQMAEFEVGLKDCHERMDEYRVSLCEVRGGEMIEDEQRESLQVCFIIFNCHNDVVYSLIESQIVFNIYYL